MSTPNNANFYAGTGEIWFNRFDAAGALTAYRHLGNVSKIELTPSVTTIEKKSSMNASRAVVAQAITDTKMELVLDLDEYDPKNLALGLLGDESAFSQNSGTATDATLGDAVLGAALDTGKEKIVVTSVKKGVTALVEGTDYTVDSDSGLITVLDTSSTVSDGDALTWTGTYPTVASRQVQGLSSAVILGALRYRSSTDHNGPRYLADFHRVSIVPSGAIALIGDQYASIPLKGQVMIDETRAVGQQFARIVAL